MQALSPLNSEPEQSGRVRERRAAGVGSVKRIPRLGLGVFVLICAFAITAGSVTIRIPSTDNVCVPIRASVTDAFADQWYCATAHLDEGPRALGVFVRQPEIAVRALRRTLREEHEASVLLEAAHALGNLGQVAGEATPELVAFLRSGRGSAPYLAEGWTAGGVRRQALWAIWRIGSSAHQAKGVLRKLAQSDDVDERRLARGALRRIGGR